MSIEKKQTETDEDEAEKMRLELIFIRELKSLFARMNKENTASIAATGSPINANKFENEWEALLRKHIARTQESFTGSVESTLPTDDQGFSKEEIAIMSLALMRWRDDKAKADAKLITETNKQRINKVTQQSRELLQEQGEPTDNITLAVTTSTLLKRDNVGRVENIATTETQAAAESTKAIEASTLAGENPLFAISPLIVSLLVTKRWQTVGDDRVRPAHRVANGQKKSLHQAFIVGSELLMHPGDSSLGASIGNIANCRCSSIFSFDRVRR